MSKNQERQLQQLIRLDQEKGTDFAVRVEAGEITVAEGMKRALAHLQPAFDLVITFAKYGKGSTTQQDSKILWWKVAGQERQAPKGRLTLADLISSKALEKYVLVGTEVSDLQVANRYVLKERQDAPLRAARYAGATHVSSVDKNEFYQDTRSSAGALVARWDGDGITTWKRKGAHPPEWAERI
jgi:hypothetical protein